jgi:hypothetical protein
MMLIAATVLLVVIWAFAELLLGGVRRKIPYEASHWGRWTATPLPPEKHDEC